MDTTRQMTTRPVPHLTKSMKEYLPGPRTRVFGGVPTGLAKAQEDAIRIAMTTARGDAPTWAAKAMPTGQRSALEAVLLMNCVRTTARMKSTAVMT